ncbi:hypothetical protein BKE38_08700 [Pseudoroseomonas deserti]|uniref:DUF4043 domain-containing protein n=1 Tax=Teichococcus deserti TaxID=1817963 RepID=A0A1V2H4K9_9PROT|nr:hypothetical protein [Pseudoroseomonas deserti]ONG55736.1 hypothetical protein BKE38_08700 [Pseudoroseomonas deserti]
MAINNLPAALQAAIQQGFLEKKFHDALKAKLGFRAIADREAFTAGIGEEITKTRAGLLPAVITPLAAVANSDLTNGVGESAFALEQYKVVAQSYGSSMNLNRVTSVVNIVDLAMQNASKLGEQASRSLDTLAANALFSAYLSSNTRTTGAPSGATITVDDIRGFVAGQTVAVNGSPYTVASVAASGTSTAPNGVAGTITMTGAGNLASDGVVGKAVVGSTAPVVLRAANRAHTGLLAANDVLTADKILAAKAQLEANGVSGRMICYADPQHLTGLYADATFQSFFRGGNGTAEWRNGVISNLLGVEIVATNMSPVQSLGGLTVRRAIVVANGALIESTLTGTAYANHEELVKNGMVSVVDDVAMVTRAPIDQLQQVITQSWNYIGGFVVPTDKNTNASVLPTASNAAYKRAVVIESL